MSEIVKAKNLVWTSESRDSILADVIFSDLDGSYIPFVASKYMNEDYGKVFYRDALTGKYGDIKEYQEIALTVEQENENIRLIREAAYVAEVDNLTIEISRLKLFGDVDEIAELTEKARAIVERIKLENPYMV